MVQVILLILCVLFLLTGLLGAILPFLPGPFLSFIGLLIFYFTSYSKLSLTFLIVMGVVMVLVTIADNFIAPYFAKKAGGSRTASLGSFIGLICGAIFFPPFGMFIGAFLGALIGEFFISKKLDSTEIKIAFGAFMGMVLSSGMKLAYSIWVIICLIKN